MRGFSVRRPFALGRETSNHCFNIHQLRQKHACSCASNNTCSNLFRRLLAILNFRVHAVPFEIHNQFRKSPISRPIKCCFEFATFFPVLSLHPFREDAYVSVMQSSDFPIDFVSTICCRLVHFSN